jgi:hypothetical protein
MNLTLLRSDSEQVVRGYASKKFMMFMKLKPKKQTQKIKQYFEAVRYLEMNSTVVLDVYKSIYHKDLDTDEGPLGYHRDLIGYDIEELKKRDKNQDWQEGEDFLNSLKDFMQPYDGSACDACYFKSDFAVETKMAATGRSILTSDEIGGEFDAILGMQQEASLSFEAITDHGVFIAKLEQSLKGGAWTKGSAKAKMSAAGLSAEMQFMAAVGGELNVDGKMGWSKGDANLELGGNVRAFAGARVNVAGKLSLEARGNFEASIAAGCFIGLEFECSGRGSFSYAGAEVMSAEAKFRLQVGIGAEFEASFAKSIFGPTKIKVDAGVAFGVGTSTEVSASIDFAEMHVLATDGFRKVLYLPTLAQGWKLDLMTQQTRNRFYLKRCQGILEDEFAAVQTVMSSGGGGYVKLI